MTRPATVVRVADVAAEEVATGVGVRTLLDTGSGEAGLVRRQVDVAPGAMFVGSAGPAGELWFVISGRGQLVPSGQPAVALKADRAVLLPPGASYEVRSDGEAGLRLDAVSLPAEGWAAGSARSARSAQSAQAASPLARDFAECAIETTGDRQFRVLFGPATGCAVATQFVGEIPPGRAPDHSHPYDEVVLILKGHGIAHIGGAAHALSAGTCAHLPPGLVHCLENTGQGTLRVLGVFHPADSPASKLGDGH